MTGPSRARHILTILAVADIDRSRAFYDAAFGWAVSVDVPGHVEYALPGGIQIPAAPY